MWRGSGLRRTPFNPAVRKGASSNLAVIKRKLFFFLAGAEGGGGVTVYTYAKNDQKKKKHHLTFSYLARRARARATSMPTISRHAVASWRATWAPMVSSRGAATTAPKNAPPSSK